jgi:cyanate permease
MERFQLNLLFWGAFTISTFFFWVGQSNWQIAPKKKKKNKKQKVWTCEAPPTN